MKIIKTRTYEMMESQIRNLRELTNELAASENKLLIENSKLEREIREYKAKDFIVEIKKEKRNVPKDKFISEYLIGRNQQELLSHLFDTRTPKEFKDIFGEHIIFTEVPMDDRFEILMKDRKDKDEFLKEHGWVEEENEE